MENTVPIPRSEGSGAERSGDRGRGTILALFPRASAISDISLNCRSQFSSKISIFFAYILAQKKLFFTQYFLKRAIFFILTPSTVNIGVNLFIENFISSLFQFNYLFIFCSLKRISGLTMVKPDIPGQT